MSPNELFPKPYSETQKHINIYTDIRKEAVYTNKQPHTCIHTD